jgi:hypothetical protein
MGITQGLLVKGYTAGANISARKIVKWGAADNTVIPATAATEALVGVVAPDVDVTSGATADVHMLGIVECIAGGTITRGDPVTSDANGDAVAAAPAAGVNNRIIGYAEVSAVDNDIFTVILAPSGMQGA